MSGSQKKIPLNGSESAIRKIIQSQSKTNSTNDPTKSSNIYPPKVPFDPGKKPGISRAENTLIKNKDLEFSQNVKPTELIFTGESGKAYPPLTDTQIEVTEIKKDNLGNVATVDEGKMVVKIDNKEKNDYDYKLRFKRRKHRSRLINIRSNMGSVQ